MRLSLCLRLLVAASVLAHAACSTGAFHTEATSRTDTSNWVKAADVAADGAWDIRKSLHKEGIRSSIEGDYPDYELKVPREDYSRAVAALRRIKARPLNIYTIRTSEEESGGQTPDLPDRGQGSLW